MKLMRNPMTLFMFAVFATMVYVASDYPAGARFMPYVVGIPALILCVLQFALDMRAPPPAPRDDRSDMEKAEALVSQMTGRRMEFEATQIAPGVTVSENPTAVAENREFVIWGYIIGFLIAILALGFYIAVPLFILFYMRTEAKVSWSKAALYTAIGCAVILGALTFGLKLQLHPGFLTELALSRL
jgi:hypothetical protein